MYLFEILQSPMGVIELLLYIETQFIVCPGAFETECV